MPSLSDVIKKTKKKQKPEEGLMLDIEVEPMEGDKKKEYKPGIPMQKSKESDMELELMLSSAKKKQDAPLADMAKKDYTPGLKDSVGNMKEKYMKKMEKYKKGK